MDRPMAAPIACAERGRSLRICIGAGWSLGGTFAHRRTAAFVAIGTSVIYTTMIGGLVVALVEGSRGA